ncbi:hypothetical protein KC333_g190 [Hortaea werneckii]|nr:hypothetical protein KC333_g190 [Hortaea werneckii]
MNTFVPTDVIGTTGYNRKVSLQTAFNKGMLSTVAAVMVSVATLSGDGRWVRISSRSCVWISGWVASRYAHQPRVLEVVSCPAAIIVRT